MTREEAEAQIRAMHPSWPPLILIKVAEIAPEVFDKAFTDAVVENARRQVEEYRDKTGSTP